MSETREIKHLDDVKFLVNDFYGKIRKDDLLKDIFEDIIQDKWPEHLDKMYRFWQTVLLGDRTYYGAPFPPHRLLPVKEEHFNRWLKLFYETVDSNFHGEEAERAKWQGNRMAEMFLMKIKMFNGEGSYY